MRIIITPNAFKGSLSAENAAQCIAEGLRQCKPACKLTLFPIADGGDDTASLLTKNKQGKTIYVPVHDPLGRMINAPLGWIMNKREAIISMSDVSGLKLLRKDELNPLHANTYGTGELIKAALDKGTQKILIGVGGSATVDGGSGLLRALGIRLLDKNGKEIHDLPIGLPDLKSIDVSGLDKRIRQVDIIVLCDVQNKLLGHEGAARIFGPQKGANENEVNLLEHGMEQWNHATIETMNFNMAALKYGGAAGGMAAGLAAYTQARLVNGIEYFLDITGFEQALDKADLVITGEGSIDMQTLTGKGPLGVAVRAKAKGIPVIALAGSVFPNKEMSKYFDQLIAINPPGVSLEQAMKGTAANLRQAAYQISREL